MNWDIILSAHNLQSKLTWLKGNTTVIFKQEYVGKYVNPDISNILFLLYDIVNYQNQLVMFASVGIHFKCETTDQTQ